MALSALLKVIGPQPNDILVTLGDVIDYGPDTRGVIDQLLLLKERTQLVTLRGNHEEMLLRVLKGQWDLESWTRHGGDQTLTSYGIIHPAEMPKAHRDHLRNSLPYSESTDHAFVHANYYPNLLLNETPASALFWEFLDPKRAWPHFSNKTFIVGHTPQTTGEILDLGFLVCIDTDCSRGGWLTALDTTTGHYWQASQQGTLQERDRETCR